MRLRGWGRLCARRALGWLVAAACAAATAQAPATESLVVTAGQSATEIAMDHVPGGTTMDQFLLALFMRNPQAFQQASLNRLLAGTRLALPTADEANAVPLAQAREQLARLREGPPADAAPASPPSPEPAAPADLPGSAASPAPQPVPAPQPAAQGKTAAYPYMLAAAALLTLLVGLGHWLRRRPAARLPGNSQGPASSVDQEQQAQGRFQPVLPDDPPAPPRGRAPQADTAKPALFDLDLNLGGPAPALDLPMPARPRTPQSAGPAAFELGALPTDARSAPPKASAPGPLDLSGLSLDLDLPSPAPATRPEERS